MNIDSMMPAPGPVCGVGDAKASSAVAPGRGPEVLAALQAAASMLDEVPDAMHQLGSHQEDELVSVLLRLHGRSAQVVTVVTCDAVDRGAVLESNAASTGQWLAGHLTGGAPVEPKTVRVMASVADACRAPKNAVVATALRDGSSSVESARTALLQADKVAPVIPTAERGEILGWFLQVDPSLGSAALTQLTRRIIARFAPDELSDHDEKLEATESLSWSTTPTGMTRLVAELSPVNAAILTEAINAKSAPRPKLTELTDKSDNTGRRGGSGAAAFGLGADNPSTGSDSSTISSEPILDERSPGKRRVDALMELLGAGARAAGGEGAQAGAATVLLTMGLQELLAGHGATTTTGDVVDAGAARRIACTAGPDPGRARRAEPTVGWRAARTIGDQSDPGSRDPARPRVHVPRLRSTAGVLRSAPHPTVVDGRPDIVGELGTAVRPPPPDRAPAGLHRARAP